jgi:hypothetical protein
MGPFATQAQPTAFTPPAHAEDALDEEEDDVMPVPPMMPVPGSMYPQ